jgi:signal transduction histidine kinase
MRLPELERLRETEAWVAWARLLALPIVIVQALLELGDYPPGYERWAWTAVGVLAAGTGVFLLLGRQVGTRAGFRALGFAGLGFDTAIVFAFVFVFSFESGTPFWGLLYLPVVEAALRYGLRGGLALPLVSAPLVWGAEAFRAERFAPPPFALDHVLMPVSLELLVGFVTGLLVHRLRRAATDAHERAGEAEVLRDQLGRRADQLEAVNRCARALGSSLDQEEAFRLFLREVQTVFAFDRLAIVLARDGNAHVMANSGRAEDTLFPRGTARPVAGSIVEDVLAGGQTVVRPDMTVEPRYPEEEELSRIGLRSRVVAPLTVGTRSLGMLAVSRAEADAFSDEDVSLITLLGRQAATAIQNIQTFEAERNAAEELRRLSALRADFVSLVSHELRAPMASVIGCAATLRHRWRELSPEQRASFLELIEGETSRLATLIGDVLDTSRIEAGTFSYTFSDVDLDELVREIARVVALGQDEVEVRVEVAGPLQPVRADRDRLRQVLLNLISNAVKYTFAGDEVLVAASGDGGSGVTVRVTDHGPGISPDQHQLIFEKFGRANAGGKSKPGAGLGLFIARSIAEAHGGTLTVESVPAAGATFTLRLPAG